MTDIGRHRAPSRRRRLQAMAVLTSTLIASAVMVAAGAVYVLGADPAEQDRNRATAVPPVSSAPATALPSPVPSVQSATKAPSKDPSSVPEQGAGTFKDAGDGGKRAGDSGTLVQYRVEVENGLGLQVGRFTRAVESTLGDRRGWTADGQYSFLRTADAPLRVVLASPATTDRLCAPLNTRGEVSCRNGNNVVINAKRWVMGVEFYDDLGAYRRYVVNHEIGHALGLQHLRCPAPGAPAPVMLQQTLGLDGCSANPWPAS